MDIKRIAVFGGTGRTGRELLKQALDAGYKVTAIARNPKSLKEFQQYENFEAKQGDALKSETFEDHVEDCDAVMSCLGGTGSRFAEMTFYNDTLKEMQKAMEKYKISRFIGMTSWATQDDPSLPIFVRWVLRPLFIKHVLDSMYQMEQYAEKTQLNYTIIKPPGLNPDGSSGKNIQTLDNGQCVPGCANYMSCSDVAAFMLSCLKTDKLDKKITAIGVK